MPGQYPNNWTVPTRVTGTSDNSAASTKFVGQIRTLVGPLAIGTTTPSTVPLYIATASSTMGPVVQLVHTEAGSTGSAILELYQGDVFSYIGTGTNVPFYFYVNSVTRFAINPGGSITAGIHSSIPSGGSSLVGYKYFDAEDFGVFFGSGAPTLTAAQGSLYLRSDGTSSTDRMYVSLTSTGAWTSVLTSC